MGRTYDLEIRRPREDRLPFLCHLNFTAGGKDLGDLVQVSVWLSESMMRWDCLHRQPQPVSAAHILYCVFFTKPLNREERWPEGHISTPCSAGCQRPEARSSTRDERSRPVGQSSRGFPFSLRSSVRMRPYIRPPPSVCCTDISLFTDPRTLTPTVWLTREARNVGT